MSPAPMLGASPHGDDKKIHLLQTYCVPDTTLSILYSVSHLILMVALWYRYYYYSSFTDVESVAQRNSVVNPRLQSPKFPEVGFEPRQADAWTYALNRHTVSAH